MREMTQSEKVTNSLLGKKEEKSRRWLGDNAGYVAMHIWIKNKLGKANKYVHRVIEYTILEN